MPWTGSGHTDAPGSPATIPALGIGAADPARWVVAAILTEPNAATSTTGVSIGGQPATLLFADRAGVFWIEFWAAAVPTGTTADVAVTYNGSVWRMGAAVAVLAGAPTLGDSAVTRAPSGPFGNLTWSVTLDVPAGGTVLALQSSIYPTVTAATWTGVTEDFEDWSNAALHPTTGGSASGLSAETARPVSVNTDANFTNGNVFGAISLAIAGGPPPGPVFRPQLFGGRALVVGGKLFGIEVPA